jgi:hypothetical protein
VTQENRAAIMYAQYHLRLTVKQLEADLATAVEDSVVSAIRDSITAFIREAIEQCDAEMWPPCERRPRAGWSRVLPSSILEAMVRDLLKSREEMRRQLAECRATLKSIVDQLAG